MPLTRLHSSRYLAFVPACRSGSGNSASVNPTPRPLYFGKGVFLSLEDDLLEQRVKRVAEIEALGFRAYGQRFDFTHTVPQVLAAESAKTAEELAEAKPKVLVAGR